MIFFSPRQVVPTFDIKVDRSARSKKKKKPKGLLYDVPRFLQKWENVHRKRKRITGQKKKKVKKKKKEKARYKRKDTVVHADTTSCCCCCIPFVSPRIPRFCEPSFTLFLSERCNIFFHVTFGGLKITVMRRTITDRDNLTKIYRVRILFVKDHFKQFRYLYDITYKLTERQNL